MPRRLYVVTGFTISLIGSLIGFMLVVSGFEKPTSLNPNAMPLVLGMTAANVVVNACAWVWAYAWWIEGEKKIAAKDIYMKNRREDV